jgi:hypothetical protein
MEFWYGSLLQNIHLGGQKHEGKFLKWILDRAYVWEVNRTVKECI